MKFHKKIFKTGIGLPSIPGMLWNELSRQMLCESGEARRDRWFVAKHRSTSVEEKKFLLAFPMHTAHRESFCPRSEVKKGIKHVQKKTINKQFPHFRFALVLRSNEESLKRVQRNYVCCFLARLFSFPTTRDHTNEKLALREKLRASL